jgi:FKBP-type peptidyl-prolyl cis-trans isomerase FkpA
MKPFLLVYSIMVLFLWSCNNRQENSVNLRKADKKELTELNSWLVQKDRERIQNYIERKNLQMKESLSGLWYLIKKEGTGNYFKDKDKIRMNFKCSLLDGSLCYSSETSGPKEIVLGRSELEAGLNEGLRMLKPGGEATFILPPFLAYGLLGDNKEIPSRATLVYDIIISN